jgi:deazaflavin-dependent oxidoreductase (nitroreductase family)
MGYKDLVNRFSVTPPGRWLARRVLSPLDPLVYRLTGGRFTAAGPPTIPQIILTTTGRKSGKRRSVQLGFLRDGKDYFVVASNFGQAHHPAWAYNLAAEPEATVTDGPREVPVRAERLSAEEKALVWPRLEAVVPQYRVYITRTDRDIRVFRLRPTR